MSAEPLVLSSDNWTPPERTPWGGHAIAQLKSALPIAADKRAWAVVGESWELSVDPAFPSRIAASGALLTEVIAADPHAWLGDAARAGATSTPLLVKLIDAHQPLSVQVHPHDDDPALAAHESGKPECWVVLGAARDAGIWLGFEPGVTRADVEVALDRGASLTPLLHFVPVHPGDAFAIPPGTVHAIGAGVTLLEAQRVRPGRSGVTYRFWDWNRGRPLHRSRALAVADFAPASGACAAPVRLVGDAGLQIERVVAAAGMIIERVRGVGRIALPDARALQAIVATHPITVGQVALARGQTAVVPASAGALPLVFEQPGEAWIIRAVD